MKSPTIALVLGSAPDAIRSRPWNRDMFSSIVTINNAWAVRADWDYVVYAEDFPEARRPAVMGDKAAWISADRFVPTQNKFGGFVFAGGTMAFTAAYWALGELQPDVIAFLGCDMIYPSTGPSHFYGKGTADPLRSDPTLRSLEAKSARLFSKALEQGTVCLNLSELPDSRLVMPRATTSFLDRLTSRRLAAIRKMLVGTLDSSAIDRALQLETQAGYFVEDGRYWEHLDRFDESLLRRIDNQWLATTRSQPHSVLPSEGCWKQKSFREAA